MDWGGLSKKSNAKMLKECPKLPVVYNMSIVKESNSWTMDKAHKNSPVSDWGGLSKKSNVKMSKECPKLAVMHNMHNMSIVKSQTSGPWINSKIQLLLPN